MSCDVALAATSNWLLGRRYSGARSATAKWHRARASIAASELICQCQTSIRRRATSATIELIFAHAARSEEYALFAAKHIAFLAKVGETLRCLQAAK
jgi:hypothetical protein